MDARTSQERATVGPRGARSGMPVHVYTSAKIAQFRSLSEIDFVVRRMNNLQIALHLQVVDSSFKNFSLRQALRLSPFLPFLQVG
jgi:hypothetical protein